MAYKDEFCEDVKKETTSDLVLKIKNAIMESKNILGINYPTNIGSEVQTATLSLIRTEVSDLKFILENIYNINDELKSL
jgi:hypothetical protein